MHSHPASWAPRAGALVGALQLRPNRAALAHQCPVRRGAGEAVWHGAVMDHQRIYLAAAAWFVELVEQVPGDRWEGPGLGVWNLRELTGHTVSAGFRAVLASVALPASRCDMPSAAGYYALARTVDPAFYRAAVAASEEGARREGAALGDHPAEVVRPLLSEVAIAVEATEDGRLVETPAGGMRVADWLITRTFELAVHGLDLAEAAGVPASVPEKVLADAVALAAGVGVEVGDGATVLLALTGRRALPAGFCVL
jgi:uncharacterized protein (TIGR03083 family)